MPDPVGQEGKSNNNSLIDSVEDLIIQSLHKVVKASNNNRKTDRPTEFHHRRIHIKTLTRAPHSKIKSKQQTQRLKNSCNNIHTHEK